MVQRDSSVGGASVAFTLPQVDLFVPVETGGTEIHTRREAHS